MRYLTKQEQAVLTVVILLLLTGLAVKSYRTAHPPQPGSAPVQSEQIPPERVGNG